MMTFETWLREGDDDERKKAENTVRGYLRDVALYAAWHLARHGQPFTLEQLNKFDVNDYKAALAAEQQQKTSINRKVEALRALVRYGQATGRLNAEFNPLAKVRRDKPDTAGLRWLERDEVKRVFKELALQQNAAKTEFARLVAGRDQAIVILLRYAGLRVGELCALDVADLWLPEQGGGHVQVRHAKGDKARKVPLHSEAREVLEEWLAVRPQGGTAALFIGKRGERLEARGVQRRLQELGRRAKVELSAHPLRHTCGKEMLNAGAELTEVRDVLGHANITTTAIYVRPGWNDLRRAVEGQA